MSPKDLQKSRQEAHRRQRRENGLREMTIWVDEELRERLALEVEKGRFKNRSEAFNLALSTLLEGQEV